MTVIGTLHALAPYAEFQATRFADFDTFTDQQRAAIALYLHALPDLVNLDSEVATRVARSLTSTGVVYSTPPDRRSDAACTAPTDQRGLRGDRFSR